MRGRLDNFAGMKGRPSCYTQEIADEICQRLAQGESLRSICRDDHLPARCTVHEWVIHDLHEFADQYARARDVGLDELADEVVDIADDSRNDWIEKENERTGDTFVALNTEALARSRLRFDARRWYLSKLAPKKYGDRQDINLKATVAVGEMTDEEIREELALLLAAGTVPTAGGDDDVSDLI